MIYGEMKQIHQIIIQQLDNDHVLADGMYHLVMNGKQFMIYGLVHQIDHALNQVIQWILLKI